jgi:outer membrane receptor protein involved in Fe transport
MIKITNRSLILASLLCSSLLAQEDTNQSILLETVSLTASPIHEHTSFDVPAQVDLLNSEQIAQKHSASLGAILEDVAGVNNISTGPQAGKPVIRGLTGERVKVLSNGSPTDFQAYGIRHIVHVDPFFAQNIEVVRGAQGVLYGSDALGGVVNVISPKLLSTNEGETIYQGEAAGEYHTNNDEWMSGVKAQIAHGKYGVNVGISKREAGNFKTPSAQTYNGPFGAGVPAGSLPRFAGELPFTNFENTSAFGALGYSDDWGELSLQHTYWQSFQNYLGHTTPPFNATNPPFSPLSSAGQDLSNNETQLKAKLIAGEWIFKPSVTHTINTRQAATGTPYEMMESKKGTADYLDMDVKRTDAKLALVHPMVSIFDGEIGVESYTKEQNLYEGKLSPNADEKGFALYAFEEADLEEWIFQAGLRYDTRKIEAPTDGTNAAFVSSGIFDASNNSKSFSAMAGSLGVTYKFTENLNLATNLSRGFRAPSIFELYAGGVHGGIQAFQLGNPNLEEEISLQADIALRYQDEKREASLTLYRNYIDNYIFLENTGNTRAVGTMTLAEMKNEQTDAIIEGVELAFKSKITNTTALSGAAEIIYAKDTKQNRPLPLMPANNFKLGLEQKVPSFASLRQPRLSLEYKYVDAKSVGGAYEPFAQYNTLPFGSADTQKYELWGAAFRTTLDMFEKKPSFGIKVTNLFDTKYRDFLDTYKGYALAMGRDISFDLRIPF